MSTPSIQPQSQPLPQDLKKELPDPLIPWAINSELFSRMKQEGQGLPYKKAQVLPQDPEWRFVWRYFHQDKPHHYGIQRIYCIQERHQQQAFELNLSHQERDAAKFLPSWKQEPRADQRAVAIDRWKQATEVFSPFQSMESDGRRRAWNNTKILPLWHGSNKEVCHSVAESGFVYFGKTSLSKTASDPKSTDEGFFGSGIYFTNSARYGGDIYSKGHLLLAWVSMRDPFPVVDGDMPTLQGKGAYKHYNAHYVPVRSINPSNPYECFYSPCKSGEAPHCDEIVVFDRSQTLPRFWVELYVEVPYLMDPTNVPQFVNELISHLFKLLQNPHVDRDQKLRNYLGKELGILLTLEGDDYLEERHEVIYSYLTQVIDSQGKVDRAVSRALTGVSQPQASSSQSPLLQNVAPVAPKHTAPAPAAQKQTPSPKISSSSPSTVASSPKVTTPSIPEVAFGKAKWEKYFGDIGVEPPLPANIEQILNSPCPFWPSQKVRDTHLLVLVPEKVNGKVFHLDNLSELIKSPKNGHKTQYSYYNDNVKKELGTKSSGSHWVLMTKDVIPESRNKTYEDQKVLVQKHAQTSKIPYELPKALEATTAILMHYVETGESLYTDDKLGKEWTYTRCQEKVNNNQCLAAIGGFSSGGLYVYDIYWYDYSFGVGCCRKF